MAATSNLPERTGRQLFGVARGSSSALAVEVVVSSYVDGKNMPTRKAIDKEPSVVEGLDEDASTFAPEMQIYVLFTWMDREQLFPPGSYNL